MMNLKTIGLLVVPSLALVAGGGAVFLGAVQVPPELARITGTSASPAPIGQDKHPSGLATAQADVSGLNAALAAPAPSSDAEVMAPTFDVARIEGTGDAVIAGTAAPGATVELLCDSKPCDRAVADQAGQFVMVPPRLPAGNYELTLRSKRPDGKEATSTRNVTVSLASAAHDQSVRSDRTRGLTTAGGNMPAPQAMARSVSTGVPDEGARAPYRNAATVEKPTPAKAAARTRMRLVSRGDSLWRISRTNYGDGARYPVIFRANRSKIRDPNLIFPGQTFVVPGRSR